MTSHLLFDRSITVTVGTIQIKDLDVQFSIKKNLKATPNTCDLKIWNLSPDNRASLQQLNGVPVQVEAGYKGDSGTSIIFLGDLRVADSGAREGADIITVLSSGDGEKKHRTARVNVSVKRGATVASVLKQVAKSIGVGDGNLDDAIKKISFAGIGSLFSEGTVLSGSSAREMDRICKSVGITYSIHNGKLMLLPLATALDGQAIKLSPDTGLIGTPTVSSKGTLKAKMLMIPDVFPGRKVVLDTPSLQGQYRIESTHHTGDTYGREWYIEVEGKRY